MSKCKLENLLVSYSESFSQAVSWLNWQVFGDDNCVPLEGVPKTLHVVIQDRQLGRDVGQGLPGLQMCLAFSVPTTNEAPKNSRD